MPSGQWSISVTLSLSNQFTMHTAIVSHDTPVTQICVYTLQLCKTDDANLRF